MALPPQFEKWKRSKEDFAKEAEAGMPAMDKKVMTEEMPPPPKHHAKKEEPPKRGHQFHHGHGRKPSPRGV